MLPFETASYESLCLTDVCSDSFFCSLLGLIPTVRKGPFSVNGCRSSSVFMQFRSHCWCLQRHFLMNACRDSWVVYALWVSLMMPLKILFHECLQEFTVFFYALWVPLMMFLMALLLMLVNECLQGFLSFYALWVSFLMCLKVFV